MNKPIRILHILQRMETGGIQALLMNIYRNIDRNKVQFDFLVEYPNKEFYDDEIISLGGRIFYTTVRVDYNIIKFEKYLKELLKEHEEYKIVHVHTDTIGYFCLKVAKKNNIPIRIAHAHNSSAAHDKKFLMKRIMQKLFPIYATDLLACSEDAGNFLFKNKKFTIFNNAIDSEKFVFDVNKRNITRENLGISNNFVVGNIGRLHIQKNHKFLIDIFEQIKLKEKTAKLLLIGNGPLEEDIKKILKEKGIEQDTIILKNRNDIPNLLFAMDVFILPSLSEGLGIVAIEAQAAGIPCLVSDVVPQLTKITELIDYLSLNESAEMWSDRAIQLSRNELRHQNMQKYIIESGFDIKKIAMQMQEFYIEKYEI